MYQLTGEYECALDAKGRFRVPSLLLRQFEGDDDLSFVINRGFEQCLMLYPKKVWDRKAAEVNQLNIYNQQHRKFQRYFYRGATEVKPDSADRILLNKTLIEYAGIEKELILFAFHEQVEIWAKGSYDNMLGEEPENFSDLAMEVFGNKVNDLTMNE